MQLLNLSTLYLNDDHSYYGGAIGNISYNLMASLAELEETTVRSFTLGTEFASTPPSSLELIQVDSPDEVKERIAEVDITTDTVISHLYFHEPEHTELSDFAGNHEQPFVIGMCEPPHPRFRDEVSGIAKLPLVRTIGKKLLYMPRFKRTLRNCDRLITVNKYGKRYYGEYIPERRIDTVPYGVDTDLFVRSPLPDTPRILLVSRLIKRRGIDTLVKALPDLVRDYPDLVVDIIGDGPRKGHLLEKARQHGVRERITFHGNVGPETLVERYGACYVFCHLSMADGWNQPALEAMASGKPVVTTEAPHNSMIVDGENGFKIPFGDSDSLRAKLDRLLSDRDLAARMGQTGRELAETTYSWERIARKYRRIFAGELSSTNV